MTELALTVVVTACFESEKQEQILRVSAQAFLVALAISFFSSVLFSRWLLVLCLTLVPLALFIQKTIVYLLIRALHSRGFGIERVLIYAQVAQGGASSPCSRDPQSWVWNRSPLSTTRQPKLGQQFLRWDMSGDARHASCRDRSAAN